MKTAINTVLFVAGSTTIILFGKYHSEQSKEHHEKYHELIKKNHQLNEWYQNHDCDVSYEPCSVSVECKKYEL